MGGHGEDLFRSMKRGSFWKDADLYSFEVEAVIVAGFVGRNDVVGAVVFVALRRASLGILGAGMAAGDPKWNGHPKTQAPKPSLELPSCFCQSRVWLPRSQ